MNRLLSRLTIALLLPLGALPGMAQQTYVVSVGIDHYKYPQIAPDLPCSAADARAISHFFHDYNGSHVFMLLNENATRDHILRVLQQEFSKSTAKDEIIFAYIGHGFQGGLTCWETKDMNSIITYNEVQRIMQKAKARRKIILAMSCYSGGLTLPQGERLARPTDNTSVLIYASSRPDEPSWASRTMRNSFFVERLLEAFNGQADQNRDRKITARELFNYVNPRVINDTDGRQHPQMMGKFDDSMVLVYVK